MPYDKKQSRDHIARLVDSFKSSELRLKNEAEAQIENNFVRPLFEYLNWNTRNTGLSPADYEFLVQRTHRRGKRPDYILQLDGRHLLVMDAKQVKYDMHDTRWMNQVYAYAYSTQNLGPSRKIDFSVLTDFQEFTVLDCTFHVQNPKALSNLRVIDWKCDDYIGRFDEFWELFERENMRRAARAQAGGKPEGLWTLSLSPKKVKANRISPDKAFLAEMDDDKDGWRVRLAKDMKKHNPEADGSLITAAVQLLIDRLIFVKALSDREIEVDYLSELAQTVEKSGLSESDTGWFDACRDVFDRLNRFYNGSIFESRPELESVAVSNKVVRDILNELQPENSPYNFAVMPVEILGTIYERFLGRVVRTTEQRVKIEDKPEVRKAGGVYYTPQYIVDYIVKNTVGKLLESSRTPADAAKLKILDPACGSGSFLLGAYQALIDWHAQYYGSLSQSAGKAGAKSGKDRESYYVDSDGRVRLTARLKRQILLNNLYGVDIDRQAVEVTRFSLSLKALEDTRRDELCEERDLFKQTVLPDLSENIKCGNSLIGPDYFTGDMFPDAEELKRVNPFDWRKEYPTVFGSGDDAGGFDAVIGNPPWGSLISENEKKYLVSKYSNRRGEAESHLFFMERACQISKSEGRIGFITPNTWLSVLNSKEIRQYLLQTIQFLEICELTKYIFNDAPDIVPIIVFFRKKQELLESECLVRRASVVKIDEFNFLKVLKTNSVLQKVWSLHPNSTINLRATSIVLTLSEKIVSNSDRLGEICDVLYGIKTGDNKKYLSLRPTNKHKVKALKTGEIIRYNINWKNIYLWWSNELAGYRESPVEVPKIVVQYIRKLSMVRRLVAALDENGEYYPLNNYSYICNKDNAYSLKYVIGILNSSLMNFYFANTFIDYNIKPTYLQRLPIRKIRLNNGFDKDCHAEMVRLVEKIVSLNKSKSVANTRGDFETSQRLIDSTEKEIDSLVYKLYGLNQKEIDIVEAG